MDKLICNDDPDTSVDFFKQHIGGFQPVKKFIAFFDSENFMLTNYTLSHASIHAVIENEQKQTMEFANLLCGYGGNGPNATAKVLQLLGIEQEMSLRLMWSDGIQIHFSSDAGQEFYNISTDVFFNGNVRQKMNSGCNLNKHTIANLNTRDVYMVNPEVYNFNGLLNCLHVMKPSEFEFIIGKHDYLIAYDEIQDFLRRNKDPFPRGTEGVNLIIRGRKFDLNCLIDYNLLHGTLNAIYTYLTKHNLFLEYHIGKTTAFYPSKLEPNFSTFKILLDLFRVQKEPIHEIKKVDDKELKRHECGCCNTPYFSGD